MERILKHRRGTTTTAIALAAIMGAFAAAPADAQQQATGRFRVLIPALEAQEGARGNFGAQVADEVRSRISNLDTHTAVERRDMQAALRQYRLRENDLDCIKSRQLAVQMNVELVMCGTFEPGAQGTQVTASFIGSRTGETFDVAAFQAQNPREAAAHIFESFENYVNQIRLTQFCQDYLGSQQWENALRLCRESLAINSNSVSALYGEARALLEMDSLPPSLASMQKVLELNPVHEDALMGAGFVAARLGQPEISRGYYRQYLELNPGRADVRLSVAVQMSNAGDPEGAYRLAEEGIDAGSDDPTLREYAGHFALSAAQRIDEARGHQNAAGVERSPEALRMYEAALTHYTAAFEARGAESDPSMLRNMMNALLQLGRTDQAVQLGGRIVETKRDDANLWVTYATALQQAGRMNDALRALDSALEVDPELPNVRPRQVVWLAQAGQIPQARQALQRAVAAGENADVLAQALFAFGYNEKHNRNRNDYMRSAHDEAMELFALAREFGTTPRTRAMASFWTGFILYQRAMKIQEPNTAASARQALPLFQRALAQFEQSSPYTDTERSITLGQFLNGTKQYIEIQELLIRRGR
jgi:tetratricopeptide (TPR) repeat protein